MLDVEFVSCKTPTALVVPVAIFEPVIAAEFEISASTIAPAVIEVTPAFVIAISPVTATAVATFDPLPTRI